MTEPIKMTIDNMSFQLLEEHDFSWLAELGQVFVVFDQQDSGNLSFGVEKNGIKRFVKYAGAKTIHYNGDPQVAIARLRHAVTSFTELRHPHLVSLVDHFVTENGYAAVFDWFEGENLHPHWSFPPPAKYTHPDSPFYRFRQLSTDLRIQSLNSIFEFHVDVESKGYVAIDLYDGSILYDFATNTTKICDIDLYHKRPFVNTMGRMWGSKRFMSPEEFEYGADIDERTNVFNMGAIAFALVGGELDRSYDKWEVGRSLYDVAMKAVDPNRENRFSSVAEFYEAWMLAQ